MIRLFLFVLSLHLITLTATKNVSIEDIVQHASDQFNAKFFHVLTENYDTNVISSPFSVLTPLSQLILASSEGPSREELINAVGFPDDDTTIAAFLHINKDIDSAVNTNISLQMASIIYVPEDKELQKNFSELSQNVFHSEIAQLDFASATAANVINDWVAKHTNNCITNIINPGSRIPGDSALLVNAIYFKGTWKYTFNKKNTEEKDFFIEKGKPVKVKMMYAYGNFMYGECSGLNAKLLQLYYVGMKTSFLAVLPDEVDGIRDLEEKLKDPTILTNCFLSLFNAAVKLHLPKFKITSDLNLQGILEQINVKKVFRSDAKLTKIVKNEKMHVSGAIQKAYIEVDEHGSEAAVANAFFLSMMHPGPGETTIFIRKEFNADHPFVFFLKANNLTIFSGVYRGP